MASVVVVGASFAGLLTGAAAQRAGHTVTVLERDELPPDARSRPGVPQDRQPHILLRRGLDAIEALLPGAADDLVAAGGVRFNTGRIPWLSEFGWNPLGDVGYDIVSLSRPLLESVVRRRVVGLERLTLRERTRVSGLRRTDGRWTVQLETGDELAADLAADLVVDASGRSSRLPHWLSALGVPTPEPSVVEAGLGYASRRFSGRVPLSTGVVLLATPADPRGGLALQVEHGEWLVCAAGYGEHRPGRTEAEFDDFLATLRDPALAHLTAGLEPVSEVAVHRQTGNRRHAYGTGADWPAGLLVVGDALTAFNPIYGQGITVAALEAQLLADELVRWTSGAPTRVLQRRLAHLTDLPWAVATGSDRRILGARMTLRDRLTDRWIARLSRLAASGDEASGRALSDVYHLIGSPLLLLAPAVVAGVGRSVITGVRPAADRPPVLDQLVAS